MKKQVLVSVDRAETRVALLEATGTPVSKAQMKRRRKPAAGFRVADCVVPRRHQYMC